MPKNKSQEKLENIIISLRDGLSDFASLIEDINKSSSMLLKLFSKTQKELKSIKIGKHTVSSKPVASSPVARSMGKTGQNAREKAANLLFNMLSGGEGGGSAPATASAPSGPPSVGAPPSGPPSRSGPPSAPPKRGRAGKPPSAPPARSPSGLPPPPKLPPKSPGAGPPGVKASPSFMKAPPKMSPPPAAPMAAGSAPAAPVAAGGGGGAGLSSLRDEMLKELDRLKKIMRGS